MGIVGRGTGLEALGEDFAVAKEAFDFGGGSFRAVGGVANVSHF